MAGFLKTTIDIRVPQEVGNFFLAGELLIYQREQCCMRYFSGSQSVCPEPLL